nr:hypothetical protein [Tanacetum cinerariifolium]
SGPKWLFDIDTLTQSMNYQLVVAGNQPNHNAGKVEKATISNQQYVLLPLWYTSSQDPHNTDDDVTFDVYKNENKVHVFPSERDKTKKHDDKAKRDDKGKSPIGSPTGVRELRAEFEEFSTNSTNRVNAASALVTAVGRTPVNNTNSFNTASPSDTAVSLNFGIARKSSFVDLSALVTAVGRTPANNTNSFNTASPSDTAVSLNFGIARKSSFVDLFKYLDDPDMPALEDIV